MDQQSDAIGERTARMALTLLESGSAAPPETVLLEPRLVVRASTMRPKLTAPRVKAGRRAAGLERTSAYVGGLR